MREMNHFYITLNDHAFLEKPTNAEVKYHIRPHYRNKILTLNIHQLAYYIDKGYSFHAAVLDYRNNTATMTDRKTGQPMASPYLNQTCFVPTATTCLSVDVDHGNFELDELKQTISGLDYALIYKTMSYTEEKKKYRVVFLANRPFKDADEYRYVQTALIYLFAHPFAEKMEQLNAKVDFSVKDPARISFPGQVIPEEVYDRTFDLDRFIAQCQQLNVEQLIETFLKNWKKEKKRRQALEEAETGISSSSAKKALKTAEKALKSQNKTTEAPEVREHVLDLICEGLQRYSQTHQLKDQDLNFSDTIGFVNAIPLNELLGEVVYQEFCCYLPDHHDTVASANILLDEEGLTRYYCYKCCEFHSYSTFDFIEEVFTYYADLNRYQVLETIFELLGMSLYSDYQVQVMKQLRVNEGFIREWDEEDALFKILQQKGLFTLYMELNELARLNIPLKPLSTEAGFSEACFFASVRHINEGLQRKRRKEIPRGGVAYKGHTDHVKTSRKINELVRYGLIQKIEEEHLDPVFLENSKQLREEARRKEFRQEANWHVKSGKATTRRMDFYVVPIISSTLLKEALELIQFEKKNKVKAKGRSMKQVAAVYGEKKAKSVYTQSNPTLSRQDKTFLKHLDRAIEDLLQEKGYFTEDDLLKRIDPKGNLFKTKKTTKKDGTVHVTTIEAQKKHKLDQFFSSVCIEKELELGRVNKETRQRFNIPAKLSSNSSIYFKEN